MDVWCSSRCGYDLTGNISGRCPECGKPVVPARPPPWRAGYRFGAADPMSRRGGSEPQWLKHVISYDEGIGSGVNLCVEDLDRDGDVDVVVTGKWGGPVWFENRRR